MSTNYENAPILDVIVPGELSPLTVQQFTVLSTHGGEVPQISVNMPAFVQLGSPQDTPGERAFASQTWNRLKELSSFHERPWDVPHLTDEQMKALRGVDVRFHARSFLEHEPVKKNDKDRDVLEVVGFLQLISDIDDRIKARPGSQEIALRSVVPSLRGRGLYNFNLRSFRVGHEIARHLRTYIASRGEDA